MTVTVRYYAKLKEEAGLGQETFVTPATTVGGLWAEVAVRHRFTLDASLLPGALVVFMPPVAGG